MIMAKDAITLCFWALNGLLFCVFLSFLLSFDLVKIQMVCPKI